MLQPPSSLYHSLKPPNDGLTHFDLRVRFFDLVTGPGNDIVFELAVANIDPFLQRHGAITFGTALVFLRVHRQARSGQVAER